MNKWSHTPTFRLNPQVIFQFMKLFGQRPKCVYLSCDVKRLSRNLNCERGNWILCESLKTFTTAHLIHSVHCWLTPGTAHLTSLKLFIIVFFFFIAILFRHRFYLLLTFLLFWRSNLVGLHVTCGWSLPPPTVAITLHFSLNCCVPE